MKSDGKKIIVRLDKLGAGKGRICGCSAGRMSREFHVCRECRDRYGFDGSLFGKSGNVIVANFQKAREFAAVFSAGRSPGKTVKAGDINAMGLMDEIFHHVIHLYLEMVDFTAFREAIAECRVQMGSASVDNFFAEFSRQFPPEDVYRGETTLAEYLSDVTNYEPVLEEVVMVWLANMNPAYRNARELFSDESLKEKTLYSEFIRNLLRYFASKPPFGPEGDNLLELLRRPALESPHSLSGQLRYIRRSWGLFLKPFGDRLLQSEDFLKEEEKVFFEGPGGISLDAWRERLALEQSDAERFTPDTDWMPNLVLIAKSTYVWLDQLSKQYRRHIFRLDHIPDEELDRLADQGFTGLWLIGIWMRSHASGEIKRRCGNLEAMSSAYSIYSYNIASDLGGEEALSNLKLRASERGIRLGADMVPNHMGIDSPLVHHHPDWFIHRRHCPFPAYTFDGPDLSSYTDVEIKIEDHYYDRSDAAVVFKWRHKHSGEVYYIYHGNDGTGLPWNDTAQFNYLLPEVRDAVMRMIMKVAQTFPIVRFDAAMTLTQKHFRRLWFPQPGEGGDIPSRSEEGLPGEDFMRALPREFWREVVDRAAVEAPDTLLLAEAFWLMESYFVRTLGMHRVYNSAFMNLLKNENNNEYRSYMKNIMEFNPEILRRYVNFMNNPDEETAVAQFGKDDKYFGICTLMATLPGLPMFGHGQVEGLREKYGMEYRRAYLEEEPDTHLIERHWNEIFPLLHKRWLFSGVEHFRLFDFVTENGAIDENIFAFTNRWGSERCLVIVHNRYAETRGWIKTSASCAQPRVSLSEGLDLTPANGNFVIFSDQVTGLQYIRSTGDLASQGLFIELKAFKRHVFVDFVQVWDNQWGHYAGLREALAGGGVPDMETALRDVVLSPLHSAARTILTPEIMRVLAGAVNAPEFETEPVPIPTIPKDVMAKIASFLGTAKDFAGGIGDSRDLLRVMEADWQRLARVPLSFVEEDDMLRKERSTLFLVIWWMLRRIGALAVPGDSGEAALLLIDQWRLGGIVLEVLSNYGITGSEGEEALALMKVLVRHQRLMADICRNVLTLQEVVEQLFQDGNVKEYLRLNHYRGVFWFNKETYEALLDWLSHLATVEDSKCHDLVAGVTGELKHLAAAALYQADPFIAAVSSYNDTNLGKI